MAGPPKPPQGKKPPPPPGAEKRQHERFELMAQVELRRDSEVLVLPIVNVSAGGVLLALERGALKSFRVGESVGVFLELTGGREPISLSMDAEVVRIDLGGLNRTPGVGLMWTSSDYAQVAKLAQVLSLVKPT
jgi:Tfp pilus assembly protein PilZ